MTRITEQTGIQAKQLVETVLKKKYVGFEVSIGHEVLLIYIQSHTFAKFIKVEFLAFNSTYKTVDYCYLRKGEDHVRYVETNLLAIPQIGIFLESISNTFCKG